MDAQQISRMGQKEYKKWCEQEIRAGRDPYKDAAGVPGAKEEKREPGRPSSVDEFHKNRGK